MENRAESSSLLGDEIKVEEILDGIIHIAFKSRRLLAVTLLRFEEHFESSKFRGKVFTLKEFVDWYVSVKGKFDYYDEWDGFNLPSDVLEPFFEGKFDPLSEEEKAFLDLFRGRTGKFYIICTVEDGGLEALKHEFCHALFHTNSDYRRQVTEVLEHYDTKDIAEHLMNDLLYHPDVLVDEVHAYLLSELEYLEKEGMDTTKCHEIHRNLNEIFEKYFDAAHIRKGR